MFHFKSDLTPFGKSYYVTSLTKFFSIASNKFKVHIYQFATLLIINNDKK